MEFSQGSDGYPQRSRMVGVSQKGSGGGRHCRPRGSVWRDPDMAGAGVCVSCGPVTTGLWALRVWFIQHSGGWEGAGAGTALMSPEGAPCGVCGTGGLCIGAVVA